VNLDTECFNENLDPYQTLSKNKKGERERCAKGRKSEGWTETNRWEKEIFPV